MKKIILFAFIISFVGCTNSWYDKGYVSKQNTGTFIVNDSISIINAEILLGANEAKDSVAYWIRYDLIINDEIRNQYYYQLPENFETINYWKIVVDKLESEYKSGVTRPIIKQFPIEPEEKEPDNLKSV